ncbi:Apoptosis-associated speck-like protein containing a CARD [Oryzias melastigma]|uniref:Apoptosis-associated speck-like protein containing a CARD n=1 Tax=Oryzias melastigma TaxID=30732 RepID=A0A834F776_ORYME|nr:Apoptosis-associated speck-like protein containing a CARD [Oryzias melastigma]
MGSRTPKKILADTLEDLTETNFQKFVQDLVDRRQEPRVRRARVDGKGFLVVADVMVSTFTEKKVLSVAAEILRGIGCSEEAQQLKEAESSPSGSEQHFVDKHFSELIDRVTCVEPILDLLLQKEVLQHEAYNSIRSMPTPQAKMRELLIHLRASPAHKDIFYDILKKQQKHLVEDLEGNS